MDEPHQQPVDNDLARLTSVDASFQGQVLNELLETYRARLKRMVKLRLDRRVQARLDASDVIQEAYIEATSRLPGYLEKPNMTFFLWLRFITAQKILQLHRRHLDAKARDVDKELHLFRGSYPEATSAALAAQLIGHRTSPSEAAMRVERKVRVQEALNDMEPIDREILALRHFEHLSNSEAATVLDLSIGTANKRYVRALMRLRQALEQNDDSVFGSTKNE